MVEQNDDIETCKRSPQLQKLNVEDLEAVTAALDKLTCLGFTSIADCSSLSASAKQLQVEKAGPMPKPKGEGLLTLFEARCVDSPLSGVSQLLSFYFIFILFFKIKKKQTKKKKKKKKKTGLRILFSVNSDGQ